MRQASLLVTNPELARRLSEMTDRIDSGKFSCLKMMVNWYCKRCLLHTREERHSSRPITGEMACASPETLLSSSLLLLLRFP